MSSSISTLNNQQKNICEYGGLFGILLSLTCLVQHLILAIPSHITNPMIPVYILCVSGFLLLALLKPVALYFLFAGALLTLVIEWRYITYITFSLVVLLLFIYHVIMIVLLITEQIPARLIRARQLKEAEEAEWRGKI